MWYMKGIRKVIALIGWNKCDQKLGFLYTARNTLSVKTALTVKNVPLSRGAGT